MAALTSDKIRKSRGTPDAREKVAIATSATLYVGSMCSIDNATGRARAASITTAERCLGECIGVESDASGFGASGVGDTSGTVYAHVKYGHESLVTVATAVRTNAAIGVDLFFRDDDSVGGTATGTSTGLNQITAGHLTAFEASDKSTAWLAVRRFTGTAILI